jgi:hypothetical protein
LHGKGFNAPVDDLEHDPLIPRDALTVDQFAKWIALNDRFDGLAWAVARPQKGVLQTQVQIVSSLVEGLHRRLPYQQTKFPGVLKTARAAIVEAARNAAGAAADTEGVDRQAAMDSVAFLTDVSFRTRATEIVTEVCGAVPEIAESITDLPGRITKARNDFAHHLPQDEGKEPLEVRYLRWLVVANVTPWLLRGLLLLRAGVDAKTLRDGYLASNRFEHFRANTAQHVKELGWELPQKD